MHASARLRTASFAAMLGLAAAPALAAAPTALAATGAAAKTVSVTCRGGSSSCSAVIGLAGGASNKKLRIMLTDTNLKLVGVVAKPSSERGAYLLSRGQYSLGGSVFTVTLNAAQGTPKGATLTLKFSSHGKAVKLSR